MEKKQENRKKNLLPVVTALLTCFLAATGICIYLLMEREPAQSSSLNYEANVVIGDIPGKSAEERQRELNAVVEEGMLSMSINVTPSGYVDGKDRTVNWLIENPSNQGKLIRVEIIREDTGELVYKTGAIRPGSYVESAEPLSDMPEGVYDCTAVFYAYKEETEELIGQAAASIRLTLLERGEGEMQ